MSWYRDLVAEKARRSAPALVATENVGTRPARTPPGCSALCVEEKSTGPHAQPPAPGRAPCKASVSRRDVHLRLVRKLLILR